MDIKQAIMAAGRYDRTRSGTYICYSQMNLACNPTDFPRFPNVFVFIRLHLIQPHHLTSVV